MFRIVAFFFFKTRRTLANGQEADDGILPYAVDLLAFGGTMKIRGCFIISVKSQVGVFLLKLHIVKREHSGGYVTDERWAS